MSGWGGSPKLEKPKAGKRLNQILRGEKIAVLKTESTVKGSPEQPRILKKWTQKNQNHAPRCDFVANAEATSVDRSQEGDILPEPARRELFDGTKVN